MFQENISISRGFVLSLPAVAHLFKCLFHGRVNRFIAVETVFPAGSIFDGNENVIVSNTMTKFYGLGSFRVGWIVAAERTAQDIKRLSTTVSSLFS